MGAPPARTIGRDRTLGPPEQWPQALKTAAGLMLGAKFPMFLAWGDRLTLFYNDAYAQILGTSIRARQAVRGGLGEIWTDIQPIAQRALAGRRPFGKICR
jgi:hypothetical protein